MKGVGAMWKAIAISGLHWGVAYFLFAIIALVFLLPAASTRLLLRRMGARLKGARPS